MLEFRQPKDEQEMEQIHKLRYSVYCVEKGFLSKEDYPGGREYDEYDQHSAHFLAVDTDDDGEILGTLRLILNSELGFPVEKLFSLKRPINDRARTVEMSRLIVAKQARNITLQILMGLSREVYWYAREHEVEDCYAVLEDPLLRLLKRVGLPFRVIGEEKWYMGAYTTPTFLSVSEAIAVLPKNNALFYEYLMEPRGIPIKV